MDEMVSLLKVEMTIVAHIEVGQSTQLHLNGRRSVGVIVVQQLVFVRSYITKRKIGHSFRSNGWVARTKTVVCVCNFL